MGRSRSSSPVRKHSGHRHTEKDKKRSHSRHKSSKKRRDSSSSSGTESDRSDFEAKLAAKRQKEKEDKRQMKEKLKAIETPEQKRARRLAKKLKKEQKTKEQLGWDDECMGYSNVDNPFGDTKLTEVFVWRKKLEKEGLADAPLALIEKQTKIKLQNSKEELEKVKKMRVERERQRAERDQEMELIQREKEAEQFKTWSKQEGDFHLQQARMRSRIRIKEGRAKPIDLLARYVCSEEADDLEIEMNEPYTYLNGLTIRDLEDLLEDISVYRTLEKGINDDYWKDVAIIADDELHKLRKKLDETTAERREGINTSVRKDVAEIFKGKSHAQLALIETEIKQKIQGGAEGVDIGYWESLLSLLKAHMAKARLRDRHQQTLRQKLLQLKQEQNVIAEASGVVKAENLTGEYPDEPSTSGTAPQKHKVASVGSESPERDQQIEEQVEVSWEQMAEEERRAKTHELYDHGDYSPQLISDEALPPATEITDPVEDQRRLVFARNKLRDSGKSAGLTDDQMVSEARKGMSNEEAQFSVEAPLEQKNYLWSDKYRPRKPRYFNRVHTGFEWNKYNQTHYDLDNPPPKIVQGYKFNIFYPDLLDPTKAPEYVLTVCEDNTDFSTLKFRAGPPYEDIAFKVVNREWEVSNKRGFRCQFQNGIFQLWFHFKKYRYRR